MKFDRYTEKDKRKKKENGEKRQKVQEDYCWSSVYFGSSALQESLNLTKFDLYTTEEKQQQKEESIAKLGAEQRINDRVDSTARQSCPL